MQLPKRKDVPVELTWDLSAIYSSEAAMEADLEKVRKLADEIESTYKGKLTTAEAILACLGDRFTFDQADELQAEREDRAEEEKRAEEVTQDQQTPATMKGGE